ncbi:MAG: non-homologous end-joining DNA ligase [Acidimicrobiales bacterium]|nr:non-homologous end-joining DNA ligase [Acidimicrobiales bacterium]HRW39853.1 non-homologous end-joining DNA ligase [Aquihabitans sp.]
MTASVAERRGTVPGRDLGEGWAFERKLDGYRCLAWVDGPSGGDGVALRSRTGQSFDAALVELRASLRDQVLGRAILDGELVAYEGDRTSFQRLQRRIGVRPLPGAELVEVRLVAFDLLWFDDHDLRPLDLASRTEALRQVVRPGGLVEVAEPLHGDPAELLARACAAGWEGLVAKRLGSSYQPRRSRDWRKLKCTASQEVVVGGWTEPSGSRTGLGALLVGVHDETGLRYAGKVGTGFDTDDLRTLPRALTAIERSSSPFVDRVKERTAHWVEPQLVAAVEFGEWSEGGRLRHPSFQGLRVDKDPADVVREQWG